MKGFYWIDEQHQDNFEALLHTWPEARRDPEYMQACYISAIPMIYEKIRNRIQDYENPLDWLYEYLKWSAEYQESWKSYRDPDNEDADHPDEIRWHNRRPFDLTSSMKLLGKFSANLWNSHAESNLMDTLASLDPQNFNALKCAIDIRCGLIRD